MKTKAKGNRAEHKTMRLLERAGYACVRSGASLGAFDVIALAPAGVRCIQVKANGYASALEREAMQAAPLPPNATREIWRWLDYAREPLIEVLP